MSYQEFEAYVRPSWDDSDEHVMMHFARQARWDVVDAALAAGKHCNKWTLVAAAQQNDVARLHHFYLTLPELFDPIVAWECARVGSIDALCYVLSKFDYNLSNVIFWARFHRDFDVAMAIIELFTVAGVSRATRLLR